MTQPLWLVPCGRRWVKRSSGTSQLQACQPIMRQRWHVDAVPHDLAHEAAELLEAIAAIELGRADRGFVAVALADELAVGVDVGLAAAGGDARVGLHALHQVLEVARRQDQVEVELAEVVVVVGVDGLVAGVERLDDAGADGAARRDRRG